MCLFPSVKLDISGPQGNAFCIIGTVVSCLKQARFPKEKIDEVVNDMKSKDYTHLCNVAKTYIILENE